MSSKQDLIRLLADGKFHSGEELGTSLGLTRSAVWKLIRQLADIGIDVHRVKGRGYQIPDGLELLNQSFMNDQLSSTNPLVVMNELDSTNQFLLNERARLSSGTILLAEFQSQGRGRRQRAWCSPFGANLYCSILWQFNKDPSELSGLSLAAGVAIVNALERYGVHNAQLKWPNDVLWNNKKLSGILIEMTAESYARTDIVLGVGLNVNMPTSVKLEQEWVDIKTITTPRKTQRNQLAVYLIDELTAMLQRFQTEGFEPFRRAWQSLDMLYDQAVTVKTPTAEQIGIAKGISPTGELLVQLSGELVRFSHGDVSIRNL